MNHAQSPRWLLIGNSRWHWAERLGDGQLRGWDGEPLPRGESADPPQAWASVGAPPDPILCPPERQVCLEDVPLAGCPPWLGVDRALAGWGAWQEVGESVLVVDAGTVLSLTRVDGGGTFRGGRLLAGLRLQLEAMAHHTALIAAVLNAYPSGSAEPGGRHGDGAWPMATAAAMQVGVEAALAAAVIEAAKEADCQTTVLTGGDGEWLHSRVAPALEPIGLTVLWCPLLCLRGLATLRPGP